MASVRMSNNGYCFQMHPFVECKNFRIVKLPIVNEEDSKQKKNMRKIKTFFTNWNIIQNNEYLLKQKIINERKLLLDCMLFR